MRRRELNGLICNSFFRLEVLVECLPMKPSKVLSIDVKKDSDPRFVPPLVRISHVSKVPPPLPQVIGHMERYIHMCESVVSTWGRGYTRGRSA